MTSTVHSRDGTAIAYDRAGAGPAVILVDGALCGRSFGPMPKLAPLLARRFTVISYDRRGRGDSGDTPPYAVEREIEDLEALINAAGGSAFVYAISSGAALALAAAGRLRITRLALYEPPFMVGDGGHRPPLDHQAQLTRMIASGRPGDAVRFFMRDVVGMPALVAGIMRLFPMWSRLTAVAKTLPYDAAIMGDYSLPAGRAAAVRIPTLVIGGGKSPAMLRNAVQALADAIPGAQRRMLAGQTHNVSGEVLAPVLEEFFAGA